MTSSDIIIDKPREIGQIIVDGFKLMYHNRKTLGLGLFYFCLPLLVTNFVLYFTFLKSYSNTSVELYFTSEILPVAFILFLFILTFMVVTYLGYCLVEGTRLNNNKNIDFGQLTTVMKNHFSKVFITYCYILLLPVFIVALTTLAYFLSSMLAAIILFFSVFLYLWYVISVLFAPVYCFFQHTNGLDNVKRSIELVKNQWWACFGFYIIMSIIIGSAHGFIFLPFTIYELIDQLGNLNTGNIPVGSNVKITLLTLFQYSTYSIFFHLFNDMCQP